MSRFFVQNLDCLIVTSLAEITGVDYMKISSRRQ